MKKNHFELFGLPAGFRLDLEKLESIYREIQARVHPDKFARAGDAERRASMQMTARVNEAYGTLKHPVRRARYLLELYGVDVAFETDTSMPEDFLLLQLDLRERIADAKRGSDLDLIEKDISEEKKKIENALERAIDSARDFSAARLLVRKLVFFERLGEEIEAAREAMEMRAPEA